MAWVSVDSAPPPAANAAPATGWAPVDAAPPPATAPQGAMPQQGDPSLGPHPSEASEWGLFPQVADAALLGNGPRLMAWVNSMKPGAPDDAYAQALEHWQTAKADYGNENPKTALAASVAGGAVPAIGASALAAPLMGSGVAANLATNAGIGAGLSGANAAASGDSLSDVAKSAGWGMGFGAGAVPLGAVVGKAASYAGSKLVDALYGAMHGATLPASAADALTANLAREGQTPASALQSVQTIGPGATLADTGAAPQNLAAGLAAQDPKVAPVIQSNLEARADQFSPRMNAAVDAAAGPDINGTQQLAQLKATTAANGAAGYGPILNSGATVDVTPVRDAIAQMRVDPVASGVEEDPISAALKKAQSYFVGSNPSAMPINVVHQAQDAIDDMASSALRSGDNAKARALFSVRQQLLDQMPPQYNAARAQYASDKSVENAFQNGRQLLAPTVDGQVYDPHLLESRLASMSPPEQQAFQLGARKSLTDAMGTARTDAAGVRTLLANDNGYRVQKLSQVIGAPQTQGLLNELDQQATMQATNQKAYQGSQTAMRLGANSDIPTASLMATGRRGHGIPFGRIGGGVFAGSEVGRLAGGMIGHHDAGEAIGGAIGGLGGAGGMVKDWFAPAINASRTAAQDTSRMALARALTSSPTPELSAALASRGGMSSVPGAIAGNTDAIARALMIGGLPRPAADAFSNGRKYLATLLSAQP
jgi:hypothetical protein